MAEFLLKRATQSHRIAHALFWHLRLVTVTDIRFREYYLPILEALEKLCGEQLRLEFINQVRKIISQVCLNQSLEWKLIQFASPILNLAIMAFVRDLESLTEAT